ncbi:MAG: polysaccharide biosynthesis C-terminal domain-containing protein [Clostridiales bacterium]|nr:polysaccharide biosynthesis C-terminal domain-containing protein [Clostridiales bacterium]
MDLLTGNIKRAYFRYLSAAFGSALISSIYYIVDMAMVGQYQGPDGTAALAVVAPVWNLIYSLGLLTGIGGAVLFSNARGSGHGQRSNEWFTAALLASAVLAAVSWAVILIWSEPMLRLFGADAVLLPLAADYLRPIQFVAPLFLFNQMLAAFLRNDNRPGLATAAVLAGGIFNVVGDYVFVFPMDLGLYGAGLATSVGCVITSVVMLTHFFTRRNTLRLVWPRQLLRQLGQICLTGFSAFFLDMAMGILTMLFNRQIMRYFGASALSVYGILVNISTVVQCCGYSVGQAAQPLLSINYGAGKWDRTAQILKYAAMSAGVFGILWCLVVLLAPNGFVHLFMAPTAEVLAIAPHILRTYGLSFLLLPFNVFSTYYFQSLMRPGASFAISVTRGIVLSGLLVCLLPVLFGAELIWYAMPITELAVALLVAVWIRNCQRTLTH